MRVMITGATTPLGTAVVELLLASPETELVLAIGREPKFARPPDCRLAYRQLDLTRPRVVHDLAWEAGTLGVEVVVHGMQHRDVGDRGHGVHAQNVDATHELVLACIDHPTIRRFVYRSYAEVYAHSHGTSELIDEEAPLDFDRNGPQWLRDRLEAELIVCAHLAGSLDIAVLRCAEIFAAESGSQLWDYVQSRVCLRPAGFDPMLNVLSVEDAARAIVLAIRGSAVGVFNIPGRDTLPLSVAIEHCRRADIPVPGPLLGPLYAMRRRVTGLVFRYPMNARRFHFGGVLDGRRAREALGFEPQTSVMWPLPWWSLLLERLSALYSDRTQAG